MDDFGAMRLIRDDVWYDSMYIGAPLGSLGLEIMPYEVQFAHGNE